MIINYRINVKLYKYKDALLIFKGILNYLDIDCLDINVFSNQLHFDLSSVQSDRKRYASDTKDIYNKNANL